MFVYDEGNEVTIWIANLDPVSTRTAILLAERIVKVDLQKKDEEVESCISVIGQYICVCEEESVTNKLLKPLYIFR